MVNNEETSVIRSVTGGSTTPVKAEERHRGGGREMPPLPDTSQSGGLPQHYGNLNRRLQCIFGQKKCINVVKSQSDAECRVDTTVEKCREIEDFSRKRPNGHFFAIGWGNKDVRIFRPASWSPSCRGRSGRGL